MPTAASAAAALERQAESGGSTRLPPEARPPGDRPAWLLGAPGHPCEGLLREGGQEGKHRAWRVDSNPWEDPVLPHGLATLGGDGRLIWLVALLRPPRDQEGICVFM